MIVCYTIELSWSRVYFVVTLVYWLMIVCYTTEFNWSKVHFVVGIMFMMLVCYISELTWNSFFSRHNFCDDSKLYF